MLAGGLPRLRAWDWPSVVAVGCAAALTSVALIEVRADEENATSFTPPAVAQELAQKMPFANDDPASTLYSMQVPRPRLAFLTDIEFIAVMNAAGTATTGSGGIVSTTVLDASDVP